MIQTSTRHGLDTAIVVVEDKEEDRKSIVTALNARVAAACIADFAHELEARAFFETLSADAAGRTPALRLILLDFHIDGHNALALLGSLRAAPATRHTPIVIFSDSDERADIAQCYAAGANAFITKPVDFECFEDTVQAIAGFWLPPQPA